MTEPTCWKCGAGLRDVPQPFGRRAECLTCHAELHVCRMCRHYAPDKAKQCREPMAEEVKEKTRANFCDWFQVGEPIRRQTKDSKDRAALADLFGGPGAGESGGTGDARKALDDLFGN